MTKRKRILSVVAILLLALLAAILWPKPCVQYGGMVVNGAEHANCHCEGFLWIVQDQAPVDGFTIKKCIGLAVWPSSVD